MIRLFAFIKDEIEIIEDWLRYHSDLFGADHITVLDHMSTDGTTDVLNSWKSRGLKVHRTGVQFRDKHRVLTSHMSKHKDGFLVPLDADEFLAVRSGSEIKCDKRSVMGHFSGLSRGPFRYKFQQLDAVPSTSKLQDPLTELTQFKTKWYRDWKTYAKTFYDAGFFVNTDQGNHKGSVRGHGRDLETELTIVHYNVRDYDHFVKKNERGARAYGHIASKKLSHGLGKHYHRRYWAIREGQGVQQMVQEFGSSGNFNTRSVAEKLSTLR